jgi:polysaccharide export outer membrane protein
LQIHVSNALSDQPIDNYFRVEASGVVNLGPAYGSVRVKGMTLKEIKKAIEAKLSQVIREPEVSVQLAQVFGAQPISGQYFIAPDGTINLRRYGLIQVSGMTIPEAQAALEKHLSKYLVSPELSVEVVGYNSKAYYVITQGAGMGDNLHRFAVTGSETVLDAISKVNGLSQLSSTKIWIARPSATNAKKGTILPVDWKAITQCGATATNYQVMPGDRIFIAEDPLVALNNKISTMINPAERVLGFIGLAESTLHGLLGDR